MSDENGQTGRSFTRNQLSHKELFALQRWLVANREVLEAGTISLTDAAARAARAMRADLRPHIEITGWIIQRGCDDCGFKYAGAKAKPLTMPEAMAELSERVTKLEQRIADIQAGRLPFPAEHA